MITEPSDFGGLFVDGGPVSRRIVVVGANGAGKTWFATRLSQLLGYPVICKDALVLKTGWQRRPKAEVQAELARLIAAELWILEGGPSILAPAVLQRADLVIWLDPPARVRFWRVVTRSLRYMGRTRPEHPAGNRDWPGVRQCRFAWRALMHGDQFARAIADALSASTVPVLHLRSRAAVFAFMNRIAGAPRTSCADHQSV